MQKAGQVLSYHGTASDNYDNGVRNMENKLAHSMGEWHLISQISLRSGIYFPSFSWGIYLQIMLDEQATDKNYVSLNTLIDNFLNT